MSARLSTPLLAGALLALAVAAALGCGAGATGAEPGSDVALASRRGGRSHHAGQNCMTCHHAGGSAPGRFTVAGTAYTAEQLPLADGTVTLLADGAPVLTLETDEAGNFYTTGPVPLPEQAVFPVVERGATARAMPFGTQSGACNMCHVGRQRLRLE